MKTLSGVDFPDQGNTIEAAEWTPTVHVIALHHQVLCVARTRIEGKWAAYCGPVPGKSHDSEKAIVLREGSKLREKYARAIFPEFDDIPYAR